LGFPVVPPIGVGVVFECSAAIYYPRPRWPQSLEHVNSPFPQMTGIPHRPFLFSPPGIFVFPALLPTPLSSGWSSTLFQGGCLLTFFSRRYASNFSPPLFFCVKDVADVRNYFLSRFPGLRCLFIEPPTCALPPHSPLRN